MPVLCLQNSMTRPSINCNVKKKNPDQEEFENLRTCLKHFHETTSSSTPCCFSIPAAFTSLLCIYIVF